MSEQTKTCTKCGYDKPITSFSVDIRGRFGRSCHCKICVSARYKANKEVILLKKKTDRKLNPEKYKQRDNVETIKRKARREQDADYKHKIYSRMAERLRNNTESYQRMRIRVKKWRIDNKSRVRASERRSHNTAIATLRCSYVKSRLVAQGFTRNNISEKLIKIEREKLHIYRATKQLIQIIKEKQNERN